MSDKTPEPISLYWPRYWRRMVAFVLIMQVALTAVVSAALVVANVISPFNPLFWILVPAILIGASFANMIVLSIASDPLKKLVAALTQADGERSTVPPPNPNAKQYERSGFKSLLQLIYRFGATNESDVAASEQTGDSSAPAADSLLERAFGQTKAGIVLFDKDGAISYHNASAPVHAEPDGGERLELNFGTDITFEDWLSRCEQTAVHAEMRWQHVNGANEEGERISYDIATSYNKGSETPVVMLLMEKTDQYAPEDQDLDFIAFAAHELRGPITVIRGYLDSLQDELSDVIDDEQRELFSRLMVSANRLSSYISNILNASRFDRRHFHVHLSESTVAHVYSTIADDMAMRSRAQGRLLTVTIPEGLPSIAADVPSLSEVIGNLIDNAIKYSNEGGAIEVDARPTSDNNFVEIIVKDYGIGMPSNVVSNLFHKFYRSHRSRETVAGTGIGLYISKAIVESHGGTMNVSSVEGQGSTFSFTVPTYASVAEKLSSVGGDNQAMIRRGSGGWIKNHGSIRG